MPNEGNDMANARTWADFGIDAPPGRGNVTTTCPKCSASRKKKSVRCLSLNLDEGLWNCHHCGWSGSLKSGQDGEGDPHWWVDRAAAPSYVKPKPKPRDVSDPANAERKAWATRMQERGISPGIIKANGIDVQRVWFPQIEGELWALAYPYYRDGELINVKYRAVDDDGSKLFRMEKDAERILWRLDDIADPAVTEILIFEGENDALAAEVAGFRNATSVPNGAPTERTKNLDGHLSYLEDRRTADILSRKRSFVLATDGDAPGLRLRDELARRLGPERCKVVVWPDGCKDANDVLMQRGADALRDCLNHALPIPISGTLSVRDFRDQMDDVYINGLPPGPSTGWATVDNLPSGEPLYRPADGLTTVVTGVPGSGKSRWVNALALNLAVLHDTRFAICSPEYKPTELLVQHLAETYIGKPARPGAADRMTQSEWNAAMRFIDDHFHFVVPESTTVAEILDKAKALISRFGCRGLIIDPWTEIELADAGGGRSEVKVLKDALGDIQRFGWRQNIHTWINAHPTKLPHSDNDTETRVVGIYDIAGGAQFANKADFIISLWRDKSDPLNLVDVHVKKARFQHLGDYGKTTLRFDRVTGRYSDYETPAAQAGKFEAVL